MSDDKEKLDILCFKIKSGLIISEKQQEKIDSSWLQLSKTSTQKRALLKKQTVSQKHSK